MENQVQLFNHPEFGGVRVVKKDEPWFIGKDVAEALGYAKPRNALATHVPAKFKKDAPIQGTLGGTQTMTLINEAGLYKLVFASKLPSAEKFSDWVCEEVLPSIRKTGMYINPNAPINPDLLIKIANDMKALAAQRDEFKALAAAKDETIKELEPKAAYTDAVLASDELLTSELIAKEYGHPAHWLHELLKGMGIMYNRGRHWYLKTPYDKKDYRRAKTEKLEHGKVVTHHYWTQSGRHFVYNILKAVGILLPREQQKPMADLFGGVTA